MRIQETPQNFGEEVDSKAYYVNFYRFYGKLMDELKSFLRRKRASFQIIFSHRPNENLETPLFPPN
jgi:hypothetical protein